ncbi:MAG: hypothetical protein IB618_00865 [Candidatus Pacearchaeota archaeon]|nr:MAG: hypothetical protein IB618_00865 [Candidatus Pacearchaeota archaeon]
MKKEIESAKKKLKEKYNFEFPVKIVDGEGASLQPEEIWVGRDNPLESIEVIVIHEAYHKIFGIDQVESFKEKDKGNFIPYFEEEMWIWNKIKEDFPELSFKVNFVIMAQMLTLK